MVQVYFGNIRSYEDLGLFLPDDGKKTSTPEPKRLLVDVQGADGQLDMTYALGPDIRYNNRSISLEFVMKDYSYQWDVLFSAILAQLHGRKFHVKIDPETEYYWDAFCTVDQIDSDRNKGTVKVILDCAPYRYKDIVVNEIATSAGKNVTLSVSQKTVVPTITAESNIVIVYNGTNYAFDAGTHKNAELRLPAGTQILKVKGRGAVTITYKDGRL